VKILFNQTIVQHKPLLTRSSYWSTLRPGGPSYRVFAKQMTNLPSACGLSTKSKINKSTTTKMFRQQRSHATSTHADQRAGKFR
jgi:hypothetical protein